MFKNSAFWQKKVRDFSFNSGVYLMCELEASNNTERSNKIITLVDRQYIEDMVQYIVQYMVL